MKDKRSTAYHEAGHAVVQAHFGLTIKKVTIVQHGESLGHMKGRMATNSSIEYDNNSGRAQLGVERDVMVFLAGRAAQREFMPRSVRSYHGRSDYKWAAELLGRLASGEELPVYFKLLEIRVKGFVKKPLVRAQIEGVAKELLIRKTLTDKQVKAVIQDATQRDFDERVKECRKRERHRNK